MSFLIGKRGIRVFILAAAMVSLFLPGLVGQESAGDDRPLPDESVLPDSWQRPTPTPSDAEGKTSPPASTNSSLPEAPPLPSEAFLAGTLARPAVQPPMKPSATGSTPDATPATSPTPDTPTPSAPAGNEAEAPTVDETEPPADAPKLPSESTLPSQNKQQDAASTPNTEPAPATAGDDTDATVDDSDLSPGELRPWLRLRYDGHTGRVRGLAVSADGAWLVSAGEDKELHVWHRDPERGWLHRRVIRWQIERGPRGRIYSVALRGKTAAIAGHGAMGGLGEVWLVDIETGQLERALVDNDQGHRQTIAALAWAPAETPILASADVEGRVIVWRPDAETGLWKGKVVVDRDRDTYGPNVARALEPRRVFVPIVFAGPKHLMVPRYTGAAQDGSGEARWRLARWDIETGEGKLLPQPDLREFAVALDATADGKRLASSDAKGNVWVWRIMDPAGDLAAANATQIPLPQTAGEPLSLTLDQQGRKLMVGTVKGAGNEGALLGWNLSAEEAAPSQSTTLSSQHPILDNAWDDAHAELIFTGGIGLRVHSVDDAGQIAQQPKQVLTTAIRPVRRVAFADEPQEYRIAIGYGAELENTFDLEGMQIGREAEIDESQFRPAQAEGTRWTARPEQTDDGIRYRLFAGDDPRALLPLRTETHGVPTAIAAFQQVVAEKSDRQAVIVGTSARNNIYVYEAPREKTDQPPKLLRQFRDHTGSVLSVGTSTDGRYLVSGSEDATVGVWPMADLFQLSTITNRWGVECEAEGGDLTTATVRDDGPLYFRGVREGDRLVSLHWIEEREMRAASDAAAMLEALRSVPFDALVEFRWERKGEPLAGFQSFPAWQPLARLFVDRDREWAVWTPAGIYDASMNGHQRFGWQINQGINRLPEFFRAAQFRARLERPDVMRRLLRRGSLSQALAMAGGAGLPPGEGALVNQYRVKPQIELLQPQPNALVDSDEMVVRAEISVPLGGTLRPPKVFVGGVPGGPGQRISIERDQDGQIEQYQWTVPLVHEREIMVEVIAATEAEAFDRTTVTIRRQIEPDRPPRKPQLHLIAIGVSEYGDPQIQSLDFAARGAETMHRVMSERTSALYDFSGATLIDRDAIRPLWNVYAREAAERLAQRVRPDDLVVMYLCGHGLRDRRTDRWYFVTADARYADLMNDRYENCLAFEDLDAFAELPCRKLAILDSCHSGAVQSAMRTQDLKSALRWLQDDMILTLTASEGHEEAAEEKQERLGRFTARLVEAIEGAADEAGDRDGIVTLDETIAFVRERMLADSIRDGFVQRPTAAPVDLIRSIRLPLSISRRAD